MVIDKITEFKNGRFLVYDTFGDIIGFFTEKQLFKFNIEVYNELTDDVYENLINEFFYPKAYAKVVNMLAMSDKTEYEIKIGRAHV